MDIINIFWSIVIVLMVFISFKIASKIGYLHIRPIKIIKSIVTLKTEKNKITPLTSLMLTLAGKIGVGSLAGVAIAILYGGVGSIFWMWIICIVVAPITYAETSLSLIFKNKEVGGPFYYIKNGLNLKKISYIYCFLIFCAYIFGFISIQSNTIYTIINENINVDKIMVSLVMIVIIIYIILGGIKKVTDFLNKLVPIMGLIYVSVGFFVIVCNLKESFNVLLAIVKNAFNFKSILSSFIPTFIIGIQRGIFCIESGIGTGSIASSITTSKNCKGNGSLQIIGVYIGGLIICSITAFIILLSDVSFDFINNLNGIEILNSAFEYHFSYGGKYLLMIIIIFFSFSTVLSGYYYGRVSLKFLLNNESNKNHIFLTVSIIVAIIIGIYLNPQILWKYIDFIIVVLILINVLCINQLIKYIK